MNAALPSLDQRRTQAAERFRALGVPHRRVEAWKYSDLRGALYGDDVASEGSAQWHIEKLPDGVEQFDLSSANAPEWVTRNLGVSHDGAMEAASLAFAKSGVALRASRTVADPVRLIFPARGICGFWSSSKKACR